MTRLSSREQWVGGVAVLLLGMLVFELIEVWRERVRHQALRQELRRFAMTQESFRYDRHVYGADLAALTEWGFEPSRDRRFEIVEATSSGWSAILEHPPSGSQCYVFVRKAAPVGPAQQDGVIECL